jgi:hypothetical protein
LRVLGVEGGCSAADRVRSLRGDLALVRVLHVALGPGLALALTRVRRWRCHRLSRLRMCILRGDHTVLAAPVVHEFLGGVVQSARAVFAGEIIAIQSPLVGSSGVDGPSAVARSWLLLWWLSTAFRRGL